MENNLTSWLYNHGYNMLDYMTACNCKIRYNSKLNICNECERELICKTVKEYNGNQLKIDKWILKKVA